MMILSRHSERTERIHLSACEFAFGARTGVRIIFIPSARNIVSNASVNLVSRSRIRNRNRVVSLIKIPCKLASLLCNPGFMRIRGTTGEMNTSGPKFDEEEHIDRLQKQRFDREEIAGQDLVFVVSHQVTPTRGTSTLWRRRNVVPSQDVGDSFVTDSVAKLFEFTLNPIVAEIVILLCQSNHETFELSVNPGATATAGEIVCPFAFHQLTMPLQNSLWLKDPDALAKLLNGAVG